jgi:chaperonin cofactor prefoldin
VDDGSQRIESEIAAARQRLGAGQAEINNLVGVLKQQGQGGMASVQDELARLEAEQTQLRESLKGLTEANRPLDAASAAARQFLETWESVGQLLEQATQNELRTILEHYIEVVELRPAPEDPKRGTYVLKLFPELRPLGDPSLIKENGTPVASLDRGAVLTDTALVCGAVEKAPRQGLEP